ncbi:DUF3187 family protein [uncultured Desulfuromonas sp.]|uniref:DUF3187 family protein n=1 Tax=uncultured Desulfuromonas sp. TaxID=181013 RepID=UPI00263373CB|nr:DUF3187 family protein [uncultured Desulfuromonas sp.]
MTGIRSALLLLAGLTLLLGPARAWPLELTPFQTANRSPLVLGYGLPPLPDAKRLPAGRTSALLTVDLASNYTESTRDREQIVLDGETYRFDLALRCGLSPTLEVRADIPYISHRGGFLDGFIEDFHDLFGLPQGGRDKAPRNRLLYSYVRDGRQEIALEENTEGLGDVRLSGAWQLYEEEGGLRSATVFGSLKLPTGDSDRLLGSGSTDLAFGLSGSLATLSSWGPIRAWGGGGLLLMTEGDLLPQQQNQAAGFGALGAGWAPLPWLAFKLQLDGHTSFYGGSDFEEVDFPSMQVVMGGTLGLAPETALDIAVVEDIAVNTAPDAVFHFALRHNF